MKTIITLNRAAMIAGAITILIAANNQAAIGSATIVTWATHGAASERPMNDESDFLSSLSSTSVVPGRYDLSFRAWRNRVMEPVTSLPVRGGPLVLFAHVEDINGNPAQSGTVTFEYCGNYEPKENCDAGLASWNRLNRMSIGSCYCPRCGGLPDFDPGPGNACLFVFGTGGTGMEGDDGFRFEFTGRKGGIDSGMSGAANFTWTAAQ
jgi:hypothetical protein